MKIVFVFPRFKTFSGAEHLVLELSRFASEEGHEVIIVTRRVDSACRDLIDYRVEVKVPIVPFRSLIGEHLLDSFFDTVFSPSLVPLIPRSADVLCFVGPPTLPAMWSVRKLLRRKAPIAYYCLQPPRFAYDLMQETRETNGSLGFLVPWVAMPYRWLDRQLAPTCDRMFVISEHYSRWCRKLYPGAEIDLVYPGTDTERARSARPDRARSRLGLPPTGLLVVTANKLIVRKNVDVFLHAMKIVIDRVPEAHGVVVGDGPLMPALTDLRDRLELQEKVTFTGFLPRFEEVVDFLAAADVYVFLEKNVPFGLTVLEAGACGSPVVATRGGGTEDTVIEGATGFLVEGEPLRPEKVADRISFLLEDGKARRSMGLAGIENARRFTYEAMSARFLDILGTMVAHES